MRFSFRIILGSFFLFLGIAGVSYMQSRFDHGDEKKALEAVALKHPELTDRCRASMVSRVRGIVQVDCGETVFEVDVLKGEITSSPARPSGPSR